MLVLIRILVAIGSAIWGLILRNPGTIAAFLLAVRTSWRNLLAVTGYISTAISAIWALATAIIAGVTATTASGRRWLRGLYNAGFSLALEPVIAVSWALGHLAVASTSLQWSYDWLLEYFRREERAADPHSRPNVEQTVVLYGRRLIDVATFDQYMLDEGYTTAEAKKLLDLYQDDTSAGEIIRDYHRNSIDKLITLDRLVNTGLSTSAATLLLDNSVQILTIDQLLEARLKGYIPDTAMFYNMGKQLGYEQPELDLLEASNGEPISVGQALELWNKKEGADLAISLGLANEVELDWADGKGEADVNRAVLEGPLNNYWFPAIKKLRYNMLGAPDYIRFAVRDVYNAAVRAANGLDRDFPEIVGAKLRMLGYSPQDAKDAWAAHWELPSPTQVFEMLHRGKLPEGITVDQYLASADYAPAWRQSLSDISYNPITRTDAKRMYKLRGDFDELVRHYKDNGYNDADANDLAEFTRQDVNLEGNNERRNLSSGLKTAVLAMYKGRTISADETRDVLRQLTYTDETIEQFILEADFFRIQDEKADIAGALKAAYVKALRTREDTVALLGEGGWSGQPLDDLMETWDLLRAATEIQPQQMQSRDLTKAELVAAYRDEIITAEQLADGIAQLGYDENETNVIVQLAYSAKYKAERNDLIEVVHQSYLAGALDLSTTAVEMDKIGVPFLQKNNLIGKWKQELAKRIPDFTLAQLEGMIKAKVMDEATAQKYLEDQGYTRDQQTFLLSWWLGKRNPPPEGSSIRQTPLALSRNDYEALYITTKDNRVRAFNGLKTIGYTETDANLILDAIDRNMQR